MERKLQPHEIEERASEARNILNSEIFSVILQRMMDRNIQILIREPVGSLTANSAHVSMKVLTELRGELQSLINDETIQSRSRVPRR